MGRGTCRDRLDDILDSGVGAQLTAAYDRAWFAEQVLGAKLDDWQAELLRSEHQRYILNCHRQAGKSTVAAADALHTAVFHPRSLILLLSPALRQSAELFRKVADFYRQASGYIEADAALKLTLELKNGSRIVSLPGREGTIRGYSGVALILVDEAAGVDDELFTAVRPMLAVSGGRLGLLSTPRGRRGFFWRMWEEGDNETWHKVMRVATECPRISAEFIEQARREMAEWEFQQEYMCEFCDDSNAAFSYAALDAAMRPDMESWTSWLKAP